MSPLLSAKHTLKTAGIESYSIDAELLLAHVLGCEREEIIRHPNHPLTPEQSSTYDALIKRRAAREPLSHLLGQKEFWSLPFIVTKDTLTPRPDSETLIEAILASLPNKYNHLNILDIGTGTGCLLLSLLHEYPNAKGLGVDISEAALGIAKANAVQLGLAKRADFLLNDLVEGLKGPYDVIISNPPYIETDVLKTLAPEVRDYEPHLALDGGADGLDCYRIVIPSLPALLAENGVIALEVGINQADAVAALVTESGFQHVTTRRDLAGIARSVIARH